MNWVMDVGAQFIAPAWGGDPRHRAQFIAPLHFFLFPHYFVHLHNRAPTTGYRFARLYVSAKIYAHPVST